jgi:O-acetylserine/cysteine efflux transporter
VHPVFVERSWPGRSERRGLSPPSSVRRPPALALLGAVVIFGTATVASTATMDHVPPLTLAFARFAIALGALVLLCRARGHRPELSRRTALLGALGIALVYASQNLGLLFISASNSVVIVEGSIPIATALFGAWFLRECTTVRRWVGLVVAVAGVASIALWGAGGGFSAIGAALSCAAGVSYAAATVVGRRAFSGGVSLPILAGATAFAVLLLAPISAVEVAIEGVGPVTRQDGLLLLYLGLGGSTVAQILWAEGLARLEASEVAAFGTLMPVVGLVAAAVFLAEPVTLPQAAGALLVGAGLCLTAGTSLTVPRLGRRRRAAAAAVARIVQLRPEADRDDRLSA